MKLGFGLPLAGAWATPENLARVARHAEALGYHSLWVFQRLLYVVTPKDEYDLDPNFQPGGPALDRVLAQMESLAPVSPRGRR